MRRPREKASSLAWSGGWRRSACGARLVGRVSRVSGVSRVSEGAEGAVVGGQLAARADGHDADILEVLVAELE